MFSKHRYSFTPEFCLAIADYLNSINTGLNVFKHLSHHPRHKWEATEVFENEAFILKIPLGTPVVRYVGPHIRFAPDNKTIKGIKHFHATQIEKVHKFFESKIGKENYTYIEDQGAYYLTMGFMCEIKQKVPHYKIDNRRQSP